MSNISANFTSQQVAQIRRAVREGRRAVHAGGDSQALVFARVFLRYDGLQNPGELLDEETRRHLGAILLLAVQGRDRLPRIAPRLKPVLKREYRRVLAETFLASHFTNPDAEAFRLLPPPDADSDCCRRFLSKDAFGLGPGVVPLEEVVVAPPCCDGVRYEILMAGGSSADTTPG
jgi:hypothetical protein